MSGETATPIGVLLVDDHAVVRMGLRALLESDYRFRVVGEAATASDARYQARRARPDVVVLDVRLPDGSGIDVCREIRSDWPQTRVLMLTSYADEEAVVASILAGAAGYLLKQAPPERLLEAIETVSRGASLLDPSATQAALDWMRRLATGGPPDDPLSGLTQQERRILPLVAQGLTNREIARELHLSEHTVKTYLSDAFRKLRLARRSEAAAFMARLETPSAAD